jgi:hypothetical protein
VIVLSLKRVFKLELSHHLDNNRNDNDDDDELLHVSVLTLNDVAKLTRLRKLRHLDDDRFCLLGVYWRSCSHSRPCGSVFFAREICFSTKSLR